MTYHIYKYPRLYLKVSLHKNEPIILNDVQTHYIHNVLRKKKGDFIRVFNGKDGEWVAQIDDVRKKESRCILAELIKEQPALSSKVRLFFSPIKKQRMDVLIEKAVELGVSDLHPIIMNRTENRKINQSRMTAQIIEASEQCERLDVPTLHGIQTLNQMTMQWNDIPISACLERQDKTKTLQMIDCTQPVGFLVGPEGGFDHDEIKQLHRSDHITPVTLGQTILRSETAVMTCLSHVMLTRYGHMYEKNQ